MADRPYMPAFRGLLSGFAILLLLAAYITVDTALDYDGECGGMFPFMGSPYECSFMEYIRIELVFMLRITAYYYWYAIILILAVPAALFQLADKITRSMS